MTPPTLVEHFLRREYGALVAVLTHRTGARNVEAVEDAVQSALLAALEVWTRAGLPENPSAWLFRVAAGARELVFCRAIDPAAQIAFVLNTMRPPLAEVFGLEPGDVGMSVVYRHANDAKWTLIATPNAEQGPTAEELTRKGTPTTSRPTPKSSLPSDSWSKSCNTCLTPDPD